MFWNNCGFNTDDLDTVDSFVEIIIAFECNDTTILSEYSYLQCDNNFYWPSCFYVKYYSIVSE